jgi:hypothetical protein
MRFMMTSRYVVARRRLRRSEPLVTAGGGRPESRACRLIPELAVTVAITTRNCPPDRSQESRLPLTLGFG